jgi:DNA-directed RNA polymerase specialized sigma24 family protein
VDADALPGREPSIEDAFLARESETRVLRALDHALDERERTALWLRCVEGRSVEDITDLLGLDAASGARGLLQTARRRLRSALERGGLPREDRP